MRNTIKAHKDFFMPETAPEFINSVLIARAKPAKFPDDARYGLIVTKRTFKHAVDRNRAKRLLRVWIRANATLLNPQLDYVFIARRAVLQTTRDDGIALIERAVKVLNKQYAESLKNTPQDPAIC